MWPVSLSWDGKGGSMPEIQMVSACAVSLVEKRVARRYQKCAKNEVSSMPVWKNLRHERFAQLLPNDIE